MVLTTKQKQHLKKVIRELGLIRGRHTELVSVYIPSGYDMNKIIQHLQQEQGTASNIKDAKTRSNVIDSLERMIRHLRLFKQTPPNGLAIFAGNASQQDNKIDIKVWSIEPPEPLKTRLYRCDQTFVTDLLQNMTEAKEAYGLIVMDRREGTLGLLKGTSVKVLTKMTSGVPGKTRAGGQCCDPKTLVNNGSLIEIKDIKIGDKIEGFDVSKNKITDSVCIDKWKVKKDKYYIIKTAGQKLICSKDHIFFIKEKDKIIEKAAEKLTTKDFLIGKRFITKITDIQIVNEPIELIDISVKNRNFFANGLLVHNSAQRFHRLREGAAKEFYKRIAEAANKEFLNKPEIKGILLGGPGPTKEEFREYLNNEIKKKLLAVKDLTYTDEQGLHHLVEISQDVLAKEAITQERKLLQDFFEKLARSPERTAYGLDEVNKALDYGAVEKLLISEEVDETVMEDLEEKAQKSNVEVFIISVDTQEGQQLRDLTGIAAILRFAIQ